MAQVLTIEQVKDLWLSIRADVKALNARTEYALQRCEPAGISDRGKVVLVSQEWAACNGITSAIANGALSPKEIVSGVISRLLGRDVEFVCLVPEAKELDRVGPSAIPTTYKGVTFRSRLEARWAVFFDALGEKWEFEPEGYQLKSGRYLPDFWLPAWTEGGCFWEVKPTLAKVDLGKIGELAQVTQKTCNVSIGPPWDCQIIKVTRLDDRAQSTANTIRGMRFWDPS